MDTNPAVYLLLGIAIILILWIVYETVGRIAERRDKKKLDHTWKTNQFINK